MDISVVPFDAQLHLNGLVEAISRVRDQEGAYPPPVDVSGTRESFVDWLLEDPPSARWVATVDGVVAGHISVSEPHAYMSGFLKDFPLLGLSDANTGELGKFFVDPLRQRLGIGTALFTAATELLAGEGKRTVLAVIEGSQIARSFYAQRGLVEIGTFDGVHGVNHVFVDPAVETAKITTTGAAGSPPAGVRPPV